MTTHDDLDLDGEVDVSRKMRQPTKQEIAIHERLVAKAQLAAARASAYGWQLRLLCAVPSWAMLNPDGRWATPQGQPLQAGGNGGAKCIGEVDLTDLITVAKPDGPAAPPPIPAAAAAAVEMQSSTGPRQVSSR